MGKPRDEGGIYPRKDDALGTIVAAVSVKAVQALLATCKRRQKQLEREGRAPPRRRRKKQETDAEAVGTGDQEESESSAAAAAAASTQDGGGNNDVEGDGNGVQTNGAEAARAGDPPVPRTLVDFKVGSRVKAKIHSPLRYRTHGRTEPHFSKGHVGIVTARQYTNGTWSLLVKWGFSGDTHAVSARDVNEQLHLEEEMDLHAVAVDLVSSCCYSRAHFNRCEDDCPNVSMLWQHELEQRELTRYTTDAFCFYSCVVADKACTGNGFCPIDTHRQHLRTLRSQNKFCL